MKKIKFFLIRQLMRIRYFSLRAAENSIYSNNDGVEYRLFRDSDSIEALTKLINKSYKASADKGMNFMGATQNAKTTRIRIRKAICIVAFHNGRLIGTISFKAPHRTKGCRWFNKSHVAKLNMLAVDPEYQQKGIGSHFIKLTEIIALKHGAEEIALDTAEGNSTLINYYKNKGYRLMETFKWKKTNYTSVVFSKNLF